MFETALILEDNWLIAEGVADQLRGFGIEDVRACHDAEDCLRLLDEFDPGVALLDINLGENLTSEAVAERLLAQGTPFLFLSGYGEAAELAQRFRSAPCLTKPVLDGDLEETLKGLRPGIDEGIDKADG